MEYEMRVVTSSKIVAFALTGCVMAIVGDWGIATVAYASAVVDLIILMTDERDEKEKTV